MSKILVNSPKKSKKRISVGEKTVSIIPYISLAEQKFLIDEFIENCFYQEEGESFPSFSRFYGEMSFQLAFLSRMTNLDVLSDEFDLDGVLSSGLMDKITQKISNYDEVIKMKDLALQDVLDENRSIMGIVKLFSDFDFDKLQEFTQAFKEVESKIKDSTLGKLVEEGKS